MQLLTNTNTEHEWPRQNFTGSTVQKIKLCPSSKQCSKPSFYGYKMFRAHFLEHKTLKEKVINGGDKQ